MSRWNSLCISVVAVLAATSGSARANCLDGFSTEDYLVRIAHATAEAESYKEDGWYNMRRKDWKGESRGWEDTNWLQGLEFQKHVLSTRLIMDGINYDGPPAPSFIPYWYFPTRAMHHPTADYFKAARAERTKEWHRRLRHNCSDGFRGDMAACIHLKKRPQSVELFCNVFDALDPAGDPNRMTTSGRALVFVHEAWHAVLERNGYQADHLLCWWGDATGPRACDYYYPHGLYDYEPGEMRDFVTQWTPERYHSVTQAGYDFGCDLLARPATWLPYGTILSVTEQVNGSLGAFFNSAAVPGCAVATPMGASPLILVEPVDPLADGECDDGSCTVDTDCQGNYFCNPELCCAPIIS